MFVVYHKASTQKLKLFNTESSAKRSATCMNRNAAYPKRFPKDKELYAYATEDEYNNSVVHKVLVKNLMTGKEVVIDSNTPWCCNPASETYWSM